MWHPWRGYQKHAWCRGRGAVNPELCVLDGRAVNAELGLGAPRLPEDGGLDAADDEGGEDELEHAAVAA